MDFNRVIRAGTVKEGKRETKISVRKIYPVKLLYQKLWSIYVVNLTGH